MIDNRSRRERLEKRVRERAAERELNGEGGAPDSRFSAITFTTPDMAPEDRARLERVAKVLGAWWDDPDPDAPIPELPGSFALDFHEANRAYREHFGESVPVMEMQIISQGEAARVAWRAIKRNERIVPPELPPGALTSPE